MVDSEVDYRWSSYHANALGVEDRLVTPHVGYLGLGQSPFERQKAYQGLFGYDVDSAEDDAIDSATMKGEVFGSTRFHAQIGTLIQRTTRRGVHGGDRKSEAYKDQVG